MHSSGSFDYKVIKPNIRKLLEARSKLNNTVQVAMPFVKATTTIGGPSVPMLDGGVGFTLGLHAIDQDVKYEDIYSSQVSDMPLIGYTYVNGKTRRIYANNPVDDITSKVFDKRAGLFTNSEGFVRIPPPGITNFTIGRNKNGLLAHGQLTINIPSLVQLESLQKTFLIPGVGMILEWGQQFAVESLTMDVTGELPDISYAMFPWHDSNATLDILTRLGKNNFGLQEVLDKYVYPSGGQYMWMFGRVANFTINTLADGSFQSTVKIVGPSEDSWAYSTKNTVVPAKDASTRFFCASDTNSVYSYFTDTSAGGINLKSLLDDVRNGNKLTEWKSHVMYFKQGNLKGGEPKPDEKKPTTSQNTFADLEDAYFMTWRFFVNVVLNDPMWGIKRIFSTVVEKDTLNKIGMLIPYADGPDRKNGVATNKAIDDPLEAFTGYNKFLRSIDPSVMIIVNEEAAKLAAANPQYNSPALDQNFLDPTDESDMFKAVGQYDTAAPAYNSDPTKKDRSFLSTGVWLNHKTVVESMIGGDTIVRGISNLLDRMNAATLGYWELTLDTVEPVGDKNPSYNYMVIDANVKENSANAVSKFIDEVHVFNKYVRVDTATKELVGSELIECNIDLSLPKRLFSQIATLGLVQPEDLHNAGIASGSESDPVDFTELKTAKISDPNDTLREMFAITVLSPKSDSAQGPDLTILPRTQRAAALAANGICGKANVQTTAQAAGSGNKAGGISADDTLKGKSSKELEAMKEEAQKLLNSDACKQCEQCTPPSTTTTATTPNTTQNTSNTPPNTLPPNTQAFINSTPWSAGFISYVMNSAKVPFPAAGAHTAYAQSVRKGFSGWQSLDPRTTRVQPGDVIVQNRANNTLNYSTSTWSGASHGDVVTDISSGKVTAVGGNVSDRVKASVFNLNANGTLQSSNFFTILRPPASSVNSITTAANIELNKWSSNGWKESTPGAFDSLNTYYVAGKLVKPDTLTPPKATANTPVSTPTQPGSNSGIETAAADFIAKEEGLPRSGKAYYDPPGQTTLVSIGYGHQIKQNEYQQGFIQAGNERIPIRGVRGIDTVLTPAQAKKLLEIDVVRYINAAKAPLGDAWNKLTVNQKVALTSYAYNTGSTRSLVRAGILNTIDQNDSAGTARIIQDRGIRTANGRVLQVLVTRRSREAALFGRDSIGGAPTPTQPTKPPTPPPATGGCTDQQFLSISAANSTFGTTFASINDGKEICKKCERAKQTVQQATKLTAEEEKTKNLVEKSLREFGGLQKLFRYVEIFPEYMVAEITDAADGNFANAFGASPGSLSIGGDLTMPGINGLRVGELFWIDRLPSFYKVFGAFQILSIEDVIDVSGWKTKIHARFNFLGKKWKTAMAEKLNRESNNARTPSGR